MLKRVGSKTLSNLVNLRAGEFARRQHGARRERQEYPCRRSLRGWKSRAAGMRLYRGTITEGLGCLMARWRPTIVTSRLGRGGGGDEKGGQRERETERWEGEGGGTAGERRVNREARKRGKVRWKRVGWVQGEREGRRAGRGIASTRREERIETDGERGGRRMKSL